MFDLYSFNVVFISVVSVLFGVSVHLPNKVLDLCAFLNQSAPSYNLFGDTESRLDFGISDQDTNIPDYRIQRKDSAAIGQTGIAVCIHDSIADITHRRHDLESDRGMYLVQAKIEYKYPISFCASSGDVKHCASL